MTSINKILTLLVISMFVSISITTSVCGIFPSSEFLTKKKSPCFKLLQGKIDLYYDEDDLPLYIQPYIHATIETYVNYYLEGIGARYLSKCWGDNTMIVHLSTECDFDWCQFTVYPGTKFLIYNDDKNKKPEEAISVISINQDAPGFKTEYVKLIAETGHNLILFSGPFKIFWFTDYAKSCIEIPITPGYYSNFRYEYPTFYECGPGETLIFPIEIISYSNAPTTMIFESLDQREGWNTSIVPEITIGSGAYGQDYNATVNFTVCSPNLSGIVDETEQFRVRVITFAAGHPEVGADNTTILQFTVRCRNH